MTRFGQITAIIGIITGTIVLIALFFILAPEAKTEKADPVIQTVEFMAAAPEDYPVTLPSQGVLAPKTASTLAAEVPGKVVWTSDKFEVGGVFEKDETILSIDSSDYRANLEQAKAEAARATLELEIEKGRKKTALKDWEKLGGEGEPTNLVLREPQLASAQATLAAAEAAVAKAQRDLDRTDVKAPYGCRLDAKRTDLGSFVAAGTPLADIESKTDLEVRLPISVDDSVFMNAPGNETAASLEAVFNGEIRSWPAKIVRDEGAVDRNSRSIYLVASISTENDNPHLQPGLFVRAKVDGKTLKNVYRVPRSAFLDPKRLLVIVKGKNEETGKTEDQLQFREVDVVRTENEYALLRAGLDPGDRVCLTAIDAPIEGMTVDAIELKGDVVVEDLPKEKL